jgi:hypothetical protein
VTRTDILRLITALGWVAVTALLAADRRLVRRLRNAGADRPQNAKPLMVTSPLARWRLERLVNAGAIVQVSDGWCYLDPDGYAQYRRTRRRRALIVIAVLVPVLALVWWWQQ